MPDETRRFCSLDEDLRKRLAAAGIEQRDMRFMPDPLHASRWLLSWEPPQPEPTFELLAAQRAILAKVNAERERDLARADSDRLEAELAKWRSGTTLDTEAGTWPRKEIEAMRVEERDRARASAIEWANTPIHRLLTAYNERRQREADPQPGDLRGLAVREGEPNWWWVDWETCRWVSWNATDAKTDSDWVRTRCSADTLDAACTAAAEQIEGA